MSNHPRAAGRRGGMGQGGLEKRVGSKSKPSRKLMKYTLGIEAIKYDIID